MFKFIKYTKVEAVSTVLEFRGGDETVKVNHFDVDVVSIESADVADVDALIASQATEISCTEITQDEFKTLVEQTAQYKRIKAIVDETYTKEVAILTAQYPAVERETWATQLSQAKAYKISGDEADAPFLKTLAVAEFDSVENFANSILTNATNYENFMAEKLAEKRAHESDLMMSIGL